MGAAVQGQSTGGAEVGVLGEAQGDTQDGSERQDQGPCLYYRLRVACSGVPGPGLIGRFKPKVGFR